MRARCSKTRSDRSRREKIYDRLVKTLSTETVSFDALQKTDPQQLAKFIHSEHPQTIALILSHLNPPQAAGLLIFTAGGDARATWRCGWPAWTRFRRKSFRRSPR